MNLGRAFIDTPVLLYALGGEHPEKAPSRALLQAAAEERLELHASIETVQEVLFHRLRRGDTRLAATSAALQVLDLAVCWPVDDGVVRRACDLVRTTSLQGRDAIAAATALNQAMAVIVTTDADFAQIPGLQAVTPTQALGLLETGG